VFFSDVRGGTIFRPTFHDFLTVIDVILEPRDLTENRARSNGSGFAGVLADFIIEHSLPADEFTNLGNAFGAPLGLM